MGATPADTEREISRLRGDMTAAIDEVQRRLRGGVGGVASTEARIKTVRAGEDAVNRARENPALLGVAGVVVAGGIVYAAYSAITTLRERNKPQNRLRRGARHLREELTGRVGERVQSSRRELERSVPRGILLKLDPQDGGYMRLSDARLEPPKKKRDQSTVIKKLIWAGLLSVFMAVGSVLARRVADSVWRAMVHEDPPTERSKAQSSS